MKLLATLAGAGLLLFGGGLEIIALLSPLIDQPIDRFSVIFFGIIALAGAGLIEWGNRGVWARAMRAAGGTLTTPSVLLHPVAHTIAIFALAALAVRVFMREPTVPVFGATMLYAIASPVAIALRPGWWLNAIASMMGMLIMFTALPMTAESIAGRRLGETSMILLLPMMAYPAALVLSGIARLLLSRRRAA